MKKLFPDDIRDREWIKMVSRRFRRFKSDPAGDISKIDGDMHSKQLRNSGETKTKKLQN